MAVGVSTMSSTYQKKKGLSASMSADPEFIMQLLNRALLTLRQQQKHIDRYETENLSLKENMTRLEQRVILLEQRQAHPLEHKHHHRQKQGVHRSSSQFPARVSSPQPTRPIAPSDLDTPPVIKVSKSEPAAAFIDWCTIEGKRVVSHNNRFSAFLKTRIPNAQVQPIYRDANAVQNVFGSSSQVKNPAEYWVIKTGRETLLLPQPVNAHQFRDLACFEGSPVAPGNLQSITPARLRQNGSLFVLDRPGLIA